MQATKGTAAATEPRRLGGVPANHLRIIPGALLCGVLSLSTENDFASLANIQLTPIYCCFLWSTIYSFKTMD